MLVRSGLGLATAELFGQTGQWGVLQVFGARFGDVVVGGASRVWREAVASGASRIQKVLGDTGPGEWRVAVPPGWSNLTFFQHAGARGVVIRSLVRDDETLEELFLRTVAN